MIILLHGRHGSFSVHLSNKYLFEYTLFIQSFMPSTVLGIVKSLVRRMDTKEMHRRMYNYEL